VARAEATERLGERTELAQQMLDRQVSSPQGVGDLKNEFHTWHDYNDTLLRRLFTTPALADEYQPVMFASMGRRDPQRELQSVRVDIEHQQWNLVSIRSRLELYDEPPELAREAVEEVTMTSGSQTVFIVHGHDSRTPSTAVKSA
jgi:hypothetical protein